MDVTTSMLQLSTPDGIMDTYEARPEAAGTYPGIIVFMEAFGLTDHIKKVTERIAQEGYVAMAPDVFHREAERVVPYSDLKKAISMMNRLQDDKVMEDTGAVIAHLKSHGNVKTGSLGVVGFCMGGRFTYLTAAVHHQDIKAAVAFYGGGIPLGNPSPLARTGEMTCPIQLFFGGKDPLIPPEHVEQIKGALTEKKIHFSMEVYPEATHGFFCDERPSYHEAAAKDAWQKTKAFFAQHLK